MQKILVLVVSVTMALVLVVHSASVGETNLKQFKRSDNDSVMLPEDAMKMCNQSFVIKMGEWNA